MVKQIFLIVLDSLGIGAAPDAAKFGDSGANTLRSVSKGRGFSAENLRKLGLGNISGVEGVDPVAAPQAAFARLRERSNGKDTTIGHWELAGVISPHAMPTYPEGFPPDLMEAICAEWGRGYLCNAPFSGTEVIKKYGKEHLETGKLIVYTSADSVFQIAAHEDLVPPEQLYEYCRIARRHLQGVHGVGRVIARPFTGDWPYTRTANRHDFSLTPPRTMLNAISEAGLQVIGVGKISDIFAGSGLTEHIPTKGNTDGLHKTIELAERDFRGLCFVNLVDFDSMYGHRQDADGYAAAVAEFDRWLPEFLGKMDNDNIVMLTADHGCDPSDHHTDHTREDVPLLIWGRNVRPADLGVRSTFADAAATVCDLLGVEFPCAGKSFAEEITGL